MIGEKSSRLLAELLGSQKNFGSLLRVISNRRTLSYTLKNLLERGLIRRLGRSYELTEKGKLVALKLAEISKILRIPSPEVERIPHPVYRDVLRRYCNLLLERFGERLESLVLFGSVARGDWKKDSDVDLLVVAEGFQDPMKALDELLEAKLELKRAPEYRLALEEGFHPNIQHYPLSPSELPSMPRILLDAVFDGIAIYDRGAFGRAAKVLRDRLSETASYQVKFPNGRWYWVLGAEEI